MAQECGNIYLIYIPFALDNFIDTSHGEDLQNEN